MRGVNTQYMEKVAEELKKRAELFEAKMREDYEDEEADQIVGYFDEIMGNFADILSEVWEKVTPGDIKVVKTAVESPKKKRPRKAGHTTAWLEYSKAERAVLKEENPEMTFAQLGKIVGENWKELSDEEKDGWKGQAEEVNEENLTAPKCDWVFGKGKNKGEVCGGIAKALDNDLVRCKKHVKSQKKRTKAKVEENSPITRVLPSDYSDDDLVPPPLPAEACEVCHAKKDDDCTCERCDHCGGQDFEKCECGECCCENCERECDCDCEAKEEDAEENDEEDPEAVLKELLEEEGEEEGEEEAITTKSTCHYTLRGGPNKGNPCGKDSDSGNRCKRHLGK
jgi:hypothetical protein